MKKSKKARSASSYKNQAKKLLENSFPRISCAAIDSVLSHVDFRFPEAFRILSGIQAEYPHDVRAVFPPMPLKIKVFLKNERTKKRLRVQNQRLKDEIETVPELNTKENNPPIEPADDTEEEKKEEEELIECGCCYGDYLPQQMKECSAGDGHKVCKGCIYRYVSEQLNGNNSVVFQCIVNDECSCIYTTTLLDQVLSPKLKKRHNDRVFREQVKQAGLDLWSCPSCAYMGFSDKLYQTMECPECNVFYCTSCNQVDHGKKTCEETRQEKERLKNPVHRAHEVMSQAVKRRCPRCSNEFQKSDGCNKMKCTCGALSCYLCGLQIQDYSHFCNHTKKPCNCGRTCELWTSTGDMEKRDQKKRREAGRKLLEESGVAEAEILKVIASPPQKKKAAPKAPPAQVQPRPHQQVAPAAANNGARAPQVQPRPQQQVAPPAVDNGARAAQIQPRPRQQVAAAAAGAVNNGARAAHIQQRPQQVVPPVLNNRPAQVQQRPQQVVPPVLNNRPAQVQPRPQQVVPPVLNNRPAQDQLQVQQRAQQVAPPVPNNRPAQNPPQAQQVEVEPQAQNDPEPEENDLPFIGPPERPAFRLQCIIS